MDIENLYETIKTLLPYAPKILPNDKNLQERIKQLDDIFSIIENMGGIKTITSLLNLNQNTNLQNKDEDLVEHLQSSPSIDSYKKIKTLD